MPAILTTEQARENFDRNGISIAEFCRQHNIPSASLVYEILKGRKRCLRGTSHNIAVLLGMKHGVVTTRPGRVARASRTASAQMGAAA